MKRQNKTYNFEVVMIKKLKFWYYRAMYFYTVKKYYNLDMKARRCMVKSGEYFCKAGQNGNHKFTKKDERL